MVDQARTRVPSAAANGKMGHSLISDKKFRQLYELALKLQMLAKRGNGSGRNGGWLRGREAVFAGVAADLRPDDVVVRRICRLGGRDTGRPSSGSHGPAQL
jgi:hypothetical protein